MEEYCYQQQAALVSGPKFFEDSTERICPVCEKRAVRTYIYRNSATHRVTRITYMWCASCRRFKGWTGPDTDGLIMSDPLKTLSSGERRKLEDDPDAFFVLLDGLWDAGKLPQKFTREF